MKGRFFVIVISINGSYIIHRMWVIVIKLLRLTLITGCLLIALSACSSNHPRMSDVKPDEAYQEWEHQINTIFGDKPYILPAYDVKIGPLEMVYTISPTIFSTDLYRSDTYGIQQELSGPHTVHDLYYSYSHSDNKQVLGDPEILSRFGIKDGLAGLMKFQEDDISIYELAGTNDYSDRQQSILAFLKKKNIQSAQVLIFDLENSTNLEFHLVIDDHSIIISFSVQEIKEIAYYLNDLYG